MNHQTYNSRFDFLRELSLFSLHVPSGRRDVRLTSSNWEEHAMQNALSVTPYVSQNHRCLLRLMSGCLKEPSCPDRVRCSSVRKAATIVKAAKCRACHAKWQDPAGRILPGTVCRVNQKRSASRKPAALARPRASTSRINFQWRQTTTAHVNFYFKTFLTTCVSLTPVNFSSSP